MDSATVLKYACIVAILSEAVDARCGKECATSIANILAIPDLEETVEEVIATCIDVRRARPDAYGTSWRGISRPVAEYLTHVCALAWALGVIPTEWAS